MPVRIDLTELDILKDPTDALFKCSVEIQRLRHDLRQRLKGRSIQAGDFRGVVSSVNRNDIVVQNDDGVEKSLPLTTARLSQLLAEPTQRK